MFLNETFFLQIILIATLLFLSSSSSPLSAWIVSGIFLFSIGLLGLNANLNVLVGFLWVVDLGVGLIFLLFLSHLSNFLETTVVDSSSQMNRTVFWSATLIIFIVSFLFHNAASGMIEVTPLISASNSYIHFYTLFTNYEISQLNLLREAFFYSNVWGFYLLNFLVLASLVGMIIFQSHMHSFFKKKQIHLLTQSQATHHPLFLREQNFIKQQQTSSSLRIWAKIPHTSKH